MMTTNLVRLQLRIIWSTPMMHGYRENSSRQLGLNTRDFPFWVYIF
jgi:hypothetical protein